MGGRREQTRGHRGREDRITGADEWSGSSSLLITCLLFFSVVVLYWPVVGFGFIDLDDGLYVTENRHVQAGLSSASMRWAFSNGEALLWHPLTWLSHMLDCQLYGLAPGGHHFTSLLLHATNTLLVFVVLMRMTKAPWPSVIAAGLFGLHPLRVESVAWVAERKDVLSGLFFLLILWAYAEHTRSPTPRRFAFVAILFAAGLMAKPMLVTLPLLLLLLDYWPLCRFKTVRPQRLLAEKLPLLGMVAVASWVALLVGRGALSSVEALPPASRLANAIVAYASYLAKTFWPSGLAVFYPMPTSGRPVAAVVGGALLLGGITTLAVVARRRRPYLPVGWFWFVVMLLPVSGLVQAGDQAMADRFTYLPSIGLFITVAWGCADLSRRWRVPVFVTAPGAIVVLGALAATARAQLAYWKDDSTLFAHALNVTSLNWVAHNSLGYALFQQGKVEEAIVHFQASLQIKPNFPDALNNLGDALLRQGKTDDAAAYFAAALRAKPEDALAAYNLGTALSLQGRIDEASDFFRAALRLRPDYAGAHYNLGAALALQGKSEEAMAHFEQTIECDPGYAKAHLAIGDLLIQQRRALEGLPHLTEALRLDPGLADAHFLLAKILSGQGKNGEAAGHYSQAVRLKPDLAKLIPSQTAP